MKCYVVMLWKYDSAIPAAVYTNLDEARADADSRQCVAYVYERELDASSPPKLQWFVSEYRFGGAGVEYEVDFCGSDNYTNDDVTRLLEQRIALVEAVGELDALKMGIELLSGSDE